MPSLIEETLASACERAAPIDFALLDADHTEKGTVGAFDAIAPGSQAARSWSATTSTGPTTCDAPGARSPPGPSLGDGDRNLGIAMVADEVKLNAHIPRTRGRRPALTEG